MDEQQAQALEREADNMPLEIGFKRLSENAVLPTKAYAQDSGFDLYAAEDVVIGPGDTLVVSTDLAVLLPRGFDASVRPRSGVTSKTKLRVQLGTIDNGYRSAVGIIVDNIDTKHAYGISRGERIAQLVVQPIPDTVAVEVFGELGDSDRGESGFGSSGTK